MSTPDPVPTKPASLAPESSLVVSAVAGLPLAALTVSLLNRTIFKAQPLDTNEAIAFGGTGAAVLGYLFHVAKVLIDRAISKG